MISVTDAPITLRIPISFRRYSVSNMVRQNTPINENMLRQVMINLVKNAIEAKAKEMDVRWKEGLFISNNGAPIPADVAREIFIPFFTTKQSGCGIGLSLSRQMMLKQGIELKLAETPISGYPVTFLFSFDN